MTKPKAGAKWKLLLTQNQLEHLGLAYCHCGHQPNNHHDFGTSNPCARCECQDYKQQDPYTVTKRRCST